MSEHNHWVRGEIIRERTDPHTGEALIDIQVGAASDPALVDTVQTLRRRPIPWARGTFWFTRRDDVWCVAGPLEAMRRAAADQTPVVVTRKNGDQVAVLLTGQVLEESGGGITSDFMNLPDEDEWDEP